MSVCDKSDLPTEMCAHCTGATLDDPRSEAEAWTEAKFDSRCPGCKHAISEGDRIGLVDGEWLCAAWCLA